MPWMAGVVVALACSRLTVGPETQDNDYRILFSFKYSFDHRLGGS